MPNDKDTSLEHAQHLITNIYADATYEERRKLLPLLEAIYESEIASNTFVADWSTTITLDEVRPYYRCWITSRHVPDAKLFYTVTKNRQEAIRRCIEWQTLGIVIKEPDASMLKRWIAECKTH